MTFSMLTYSKQLIIKNDRLCKLEPVILSEFERSYLSCLELQLHFTDLKQVLEYLEQGFKWQEIGMSPSIQILKMQHLDNSFKFMSQKRRQKDHFGCMLKSVHL